MQQLELPDTPMAASRARSFAAHALSGARPEVVADVQLVLTELVTNAQLHGTAPVVVRVGPDGDGARVEVQDAGRGRLVLPAPSVDAMTGRGLSLVAALVASWGVEAAEHHGKTVWAVLEPGSSLDAEQPDIDVDALLAAWPAEPDDPECTVRLGAVPTGLLLDAKRHVDNVVRELTFLRAAADGPLPAEVETLIDTVTRGFARARAGIKEQAAAAAGRGDAQTDLVLTLPVSSVRAGERYLVALDEVDRYAREARLLTLETPPLHRLFRRWYVTSLLEQLRAAAAGGAPVRTEPFVEVLVREVGELSALRGAAHRLDLLQRVNAALASDDSAPSMARTVLGAAVTELGAVTARVYVAEHGVLRALGQDAAPSAATSGFDVVPLDADLPGPIVFRTGQPLVTRTLHELEERFPQLRGVYSSERVLHVVPVGTSTSTTGVLALAFPPSSVYDDAAQTAYVTAFADALGSGLDRLRAAEARAARGDAGAQVWVSSGGEQRLRDLAEAAAAIAGARSVEDLLRLVSEGARGIVGTHQAVATRLYGGSWEHAVTQVTLSDEYRQWRDYDVVPRGLGVLNAVTRENRPLRLTAQQLHEHPEFRGLRDAPGHPPLPDYLAAPLVSRDGRNIGLIQLSHKLDGTEFDEADEAITVQLALMVSAALEHVEVAADLERALARLRDDQVVVNAVHDVGRAVTARLEHEDVVQVVTDAATTMVGAQFGAFFYNVIGDTGESYSLYTISGVPREAFSSFPMPRNTAVFAPTFDGKGVVRLDDVTADPRYGLSGPHHGMPAGHLPVRSYLAVPVLLSTGEVVGGLFLGHEDVAVFDDKAERLAVGIAGYAAIALENTRLYDAARRESREKEEVAAALEQPLQPPELPVVPGLDLAAVFEPLGGTGRLGGDFYDAFPLPGGRWVLALGDVAGKGPAAAALAGLVRHTLWGTAQSACGVVEVATTVNAALLRQHSDRFATLVLALLTPTDGGVQVEAVWAGHPPAVVLGEHGARLVSGAGMPLGMFPDAALEPVRFVLLPGESLLLYTDGLLEREGAVLDEAELGELLGQGRGVPVDEALSGLVASIDARHGARDDVAAVALRVHPA